MNNTFSLHQISRTSNLDASLIFRQNKLNLMVDFMKVKYGNPKLKQFEIAKKIRFVFYSTKLQKRYKYGLTIQNSSRYHH